MWDKLCLKMLTKISVLTAVCAILNPLAVMADDEASSYQRALEQWSQKIPELEQNDSGDTLKEIALIRSWIGQGQAFVASEQLDKIDPLIERIEVLATFVRVRQKRIAAEGEARKAAAALVELKQAITKVQAEVAKLAEQIKQAEGAGK